MVLHHRVPGSGSFNTARGVRALVDSPNFASITGSSVFYGDLPALASSTGDGDFAFSLAQPASAFTWIPVTVTIVDASDNLSSEEILLPVVQAVKRKKGSRGPCFVATALWGTEHRKTERLRDVRDQYLLENGSGQAFVELYYQYSPAPAQWVKSRPGVKRALSALFSTIFWPFFL